MAGYIGSKSAGLISGIDASVAELNLNDKSSANGTTEANKVLTADANKDVTAIRNLTATGTVTRALTRGSIDVGNSSGVSSALAKGAAGTVLTSDGTDLSFVAASGGGEQTFTATGAITAGHPVGLNSNGTISSLISPFGPVASQSPSFSTNNNADIIDYNSSNNTITGLTSNISGGSGGWKLQVASIDASLNITFGTAVQVPGADRGVYTDDTNVARDLSTGKYLVIYQETNPGVNLRAAVATVSGTTAVSYTHLTLPTTD